METRGWLLDQLEKFFAARNAELEAEMKPELKAELEAELKPELKAWLEAELEPELKAWLEAELEPVLPAVLEPVLPAVLEPELQAVLESELQAALEARLKARREAELEARLKARREAELDAWLRRCYDIFKPCELEEGAPALTKELIEERIRYLESVEERRREEALVWRSSFLFSDFWSCSLGSERTLGCPRMYGKGLKDYVEQVPDSRSGSLLSLFSETRESSWDGLEEFCAAWARLKARREARLKVQLKARREARLKVQLKALREELKAQREAQREALREAQRDAWLRLCYAAFKPCELEEGAPALNKELIEERIRYLESVEERRREEALVRRSSFLFSDYRSPDRDVSIIPYQYAAQVPDFWSCSLGSERTLGCPRVYGKDLKDYVEQVPDSRSGDSERTLSPYLMGTSVLGLKYRDGILMAADMGGSYGSSLRYKTIDRIKPIGKHSLLGASGEISDFQEILHYLDELILYDNMWDDGNSLGPKEVHNYLTRVMYNRRNEFNPLWNSLVLGGVKNEQKYLGMVSMIGVSSEENHVATGFGDHLARPILRDEWNENLSFEDGVKLLEKRMRVLLYRDRSAVNKLQQLGPSLFPFESVKEGQPARLVQDPDSKVAYETGTKTNTVGGPHGDAALPGHEKILKVKTVIIIIIVVIGTVVVVVIVID